jgi:hypothetical protein
MQENADFIGDPGRIAGAKHRQWVTSTNRAYGTYWCQRRFSRDGAVHFSRSPKCAPMRMAANFAKLPGLLQRED